MCKYLKFDDSPEALNRFYSNEQLEPPTHTVLMGDFMSMAKHDIVCPVCFDSKGVLVNYSSVQPCWTCQEKGFKIVQFSTRWQKFLKRWF